MGWVRLTFIFFLFPAAASAHTPSLETLARNIQKTVHQKPTGTLAQKRHEQTLNKQIDELRQSLSDIIPPQNEMTSEKVTKLANLIRVNPIPGAVKIVIPVIKGPHRGSLIEIRIKEPSASQVLDSIPGSYTTETQQ